MKRTLVLFLSVMLIFSGCISASTPSASSLLTDTPASTATFTGVPEAGMPTPQATFVPMLPVATPAVTTTPAPTISVSNRPTSTLPTETPEIRPLLPQAEPPAGVDSWQICRGELETKGFSFTYQFLYPSDWFAYENSSEGDCLQVQSVPFHEGDLPPGAAKVEVSAAACALPSDCEFRGQPVTAGGLDGYTNGYYDDVFGLVFYEVVLRKEEAVFRLTMLVNAMSEQADYVALLGYMLSTLVIE